MNRSRKALRGAVIGATASGGFIAALQTLFYLGESLPPDHSLEDSGQRPVGPESGVAALFGAIGGAVVGAFS